MYEYEASMHVFSAWSFPFQLIHRVITRENPESVQYPGATVRYCTIYAQEHTPFPTDLMELWGAIK